MGIRSAFEFVGDSLQRQIVGKRWSIMDHAEVMLEHYPDAPQLIQPTELMPTTAIERVEELDLAEIVPIRSHVEAAALDAEAIRSQIDDIRREAA